MRDVYLDRLRFMLIAAVSGATSFASCSEHSANEKAEGAGDAGGMGGAPVDPGLRGCAAEAPMSANLLECEGPVGFAHRPTASSCALPERMGTAQGGQGGEGGVSTGARTGFTGSACDDDSDCNEGSNGYCLEGGAGINGGCLYACEKDADCGVGSLCACEPQQGRELGVCRPASCSTDADCEEGSLCASPIGPQVLCGIYGTMEFHCQTAEDECMKSADCPFMGAGQCVRQGSHNGCQQGFYCGRPFVVAGAVRQATAEPRAGWSGSVKAEARLALDDATRAAVARHFVEAGLMEHASIAAFARFSLQLLALGAPAELVEASAKATADETRHAELCFGIARRYSEKSVGPGPLALEGALERVELLDVVDLVFTEGCIGETCAALELAWTAARTADESLRRMLEGIAEDESRHAALAFRFVAWASKQDPRVAPRVRARLAEALRTVPTPAEVLVTTEREAKLLEHGVPNAALRTLARASALAKVVSEAVRAFGVEDAAA